MFYCRNTTNKLIKNAIKTFFKAKDKRRSFKAKRMNSFEGLNEEPTFRAYSADRQSKHSQIQPHFLIINESMNYILLILDETVYEENTSPQGIKKTVNFNFETLVSK